MKNLLALPVFFLSWGVADAAAPAVSSDPATLRVSVSPAAVPAGSPAKVTCELVPADGIKINRYPRVKVSVAAQPGVAGSAEGSVGSDEPPPVDATEANYFKKVDAIVFDLPIPADAAPGRHDVKARLVYYYCVAASGYCAPKRTDVSIPVTVR